MLYNVMLFLLPYLAHLNAGWLMQFIDCDTVLL